MHINNVEGYMWLKLAHIIDSTTRYYRIGKSSSYALHMLYFSINRAFIIKYIASYTAIAYVAIWNVYILHLLMYYYTVHWV